MQRVWVSTRSCAMTSGIEFALQRCIPLADPRGWWLIRLKIYSETHRASWIPRCFEYQERRGWSIFNNNNARMLFRRCIMQVRYRDAHFYRSILIFWHLCLELARTAKYHSAKLQPIRKSRDEGIACCSCFTLLAQPLRFQDHNLLQLDTLRLKTKRLRRDFRIGTAERGRIVSRGFR